MILSIKPVSNREGHSYPLQPPSMSRCPNCSGPGKVFVSFIYYLFVSNNNDRTELLGGLLAARFMDITFVGDVPDMSVHRNGHG
jgi:hypothetical protein